MPCHHSNHQSFTLLISHKLQAAIPPHCFKRSTTRSLLYTAVDLAIAGFFLYLATLIPSAPSVLPYLLWPVYWYAQGAVLTGLWVIAHECGHRAFSDNIEFGDLIGLVLHSCLLVPYHSWRISHAKHHLRTNDLERDEVFIPPTESEMGGEVHGFDEIPGPLSVALRLITIFKFAVFGWPTYLLTHVTGRKYGSHTDHFNPTSPLFSAKDRRDIILSDIALVSVIAGLFVAGQVWGSMWMIKVYVIPYLVVNFWLVTITNLQHTDTRVPHYRGKEWTWLKGALCTVDRDYGFLNIVFHHIGDTHVAHHLFSKMPHYHAQEATAALRKVLGPYYATVNVSPGLAGIAEALWDTTTHCRFVDDKAEVAWFKDRTTSKVE